MPGNTANALRLRLVRVPGRRLAMVAGLLTVLALGAVAVGHTRDARHAAPPASPAVSVKSGAAPTTPEELAAQPAARAASGAVPAGAPIAGDTAGTAGTAALPSLDTGRTIIRGGSVDLDVTSVADAFDHVRRIASASGGFVADSSFTGTGEQQAAHLTIRVPEDRFADVITQLRALAATVRSVSTSSRDVTAEYTDIEATLGNLRAVEAQYVQLLGRAGNIGEVLQVQDRLNQVRLQIDRTEARRRLLASQSALSSIDVSLRPSAAAPPAVGEPASGPLAAARGAWHASLRTLETIATYALVAVVYAWWIVPLVGAGLLGMRRLRRSRDGATTAV